MDNSTEDTWKVCVDKDYCLYVDFNDTRVCDATENVVGECSMIACPYRLDSDVLVKAIKTIASSLVPDGNESDNKLARHIAGVRKVAREALNFGANRHLNT